MPVVTVDRISRPEELVEFLADYIGRSTLPFEYIAKYDETLTPSYPALHINAAPFTKDLHGTATFLIGMRAFIHVLHSNMMTDRRTRNYEDLALATRLVDFLESDMELGNRVIHSYVESEAPGVLPPRVTKGDAVVCTRLTWFGINETRFK